MITVTINTTVGRYQEQSDALIGADVLLVFLEDTHYDHVGITSAPTGRKVWADTSSGILLFDSNLMFTVGAKITVLKN